MNATVTAGVTWGSLPPDVRRLVAFDLRRFRWLVVLLVAMELARATFAESTLHLLPAAIGDRFGGAFGKTELTLFDALLWLVTAGATAVLVQADLPSGDGGFWRTRPIPPLTLALGKLTTCALLFVALPWIVTSARLLAYAAPPSAIAASLVQFAVLAGAVVVPAWALALATRTLPRLLAVVVGLLAASYVGVGAVFYWWGVWSVGAGSVASNVRGMPSLAVDWQRVDAFGWWGALLLTAAALGLLLAHYRHRRGWISVAAGAALLSAALQMPAPNRAPQAPPDLERLIAGHLGVGSIGLMPTSVIASHQRFSVPYPVPLSLMLTLPPLPPNVSASVFLRGIRIQGRGLVEPRDAWQCCFNGGVAGAIAPSLAEPAHDGRYSATSQGFEVDISELDRLRGQTVRIDAQGEVRLLRHRLAAVVPLRAGASARVGNHLIEVLDYERRRSTLLVRHAEFPTVAGPPFSDVLLYVGNSDRSRVGVTETGWGGPSINVMMAGPQPTSEGRRWVERQHVFVHDARALGSDLSLYVVDTRDIGTVWTRVAQGGLPVWQPREPVTP